MMKTLFPRTCGLLVIGALIMMPLVILGGCEQDGSEPPAQVQGTSQVKGASQQSGEQNKAVKQGTPPLSGRPVQTEPTPIVRAIRESDIDRVEALLDAGASVNEQDENWYSLLHHAARVGEYEVAKLLIERGADVNVRGRLNITPLMWATRADNLELCKLLVENGADVNARSGVGDKHTVLSYAVEVNYVHLVDYFQSVGGEM